MAADSMLVEFQLNQAKLIKSVLQLSLKGRWLHSYYRSFRWVGRLVLSLHERT